MDCHYSHSAAAAVRPIEPEPEPDFVKPTLQPTDLLTDCSSEGIDEYLDAARSGDALLIRTVERKHVERHTPVLLHRRHMRVCAHAVQHGVNPAEPAADTHCLSGPIANRQSRFDACAAIGHGTGARGAHSATSTRLSSLNASRASARQPYLRVRVHACAGMCV